MAESLAKRLIDAGVHFGHRASRWNPKMAPYIYARKNLIHIIDIRETIRGLLRAQKYVRQVAARGGLVLFVGTKRQASETIEREATRCGAPYVNNRWLGGTLTNFRTIRSRLTRLEELERIFSGDEISSYSKKMQSSLNREYRKMYRNLNGMRNMNRLPECLFVVDPKKEQNAIREARKLGITTIALIDTDCDPDWVDLPIPGNDDGIRSIELIVSLMADAVIAGKAEAPQAKEGQAESKQAQAAAETAAAAAAAVAAAAAERKASGGQPSVSESAAEQPATVVQADDASQGAAGPEQSDSEATGGSESSNVEAAAE